MGNVKVFVDSCHHENKLVEMLKSRGLEVTRKALKTADVVLQSSGITWMYELKQATNLVSDVLGGRYGHSQWSTEQSRLAGEVDVGKGATKCGLMLWGPMPICSSAHSYGHGESGMTGEAFYTVLQRAQHAYNLEVVTRPTLEAAADWLALLVRNIDAEKITTPGTIDPDAKPPDLTRKRKRDDSPQELLASMLARLPGLTEKTAKLLASMYPTMSKLKAAGAVELAKFRGGDMKKALGPAIAGQIVSVL